MGGFAAHFACGFSSFGGVDTRFLIIVLEDFARGSLIISNDNTGFVCCWFSIKKLRTIDNINRKITSKQSAARAGSLYGFRLLLVLVRPVQRRFRPRSLQRLAVLIRLAAHGESFLH